MTPPPVPLTKSIGPKGQRTGGGVITVEEAKQILTDQMLKGPKAIVPLEKASRSVLAEDLYAPFDFPLFDSSAMDGYAIHYEETQGASPAHPARFKLTGLLAAGDPATRALGPGETMRIMTGAMVPTGASAVIPQEEVLQEDATTLVVTREVKVLENVRPKGEEIKNGELSLSQNTPLTSAAIGFLASLGLLEIPVYRPPRIFILPTGGELVRHPARLTPGKIMDSSSFAIQSAMAKLGLAPKVSEPIPDLRDPLQTKLEAALAEFDFILITGGVSVGAFDLVKDVLRELGLETLFWQVAQKPGKPLYLGRRSSTFVWGLPGNPASSLVCFYEYVRPAVLKWLGYTNCFLSEDRAKLLTPFRKKPDRAHFVRAFAERDADGLRVRVLEGQDSHRMKSFALANCLLVAPQASSKLEEGETVTIHWLPEQQGGER